MTSWTHGFKGSKEATHSPKQLRHNLACTQIFIVLYIILFALQMENKQIECILYALNNVPFIFITRLVFKQVLVRSCVVCIIMGVFGAKSPFLSSKRLSP